MTSEPYQPRKPEPGEVFSFYDWMLWRYLGKDNPRGDCAADMRWESDTWPTENTWEAVEHYLLHGHDHPACPKCIDAFKECWRCYQQYRSAAMQQ